MKSSAIAVVALLGMATLAEAGGYDVGSQFQVRSRFRAPVRQSHGFSAGFQFQRAPVYAPSAQFAFQRAPVYAPPAQFSVQQSYSFQQQQVFDAAPVYVPRAPLYAPSCGAGAQFDTGYGGGCTPVGAGFQFRARGSFYR